jgi:hypothetical protein
VNNKKEGFVGMVATFRYWFRTVVMDVLALFTLATISVVPTFNG